jgi:hypothetical protein
MKTKKTVILGTIISVLVLLSLVLFSRSGAAEPAPVSLNPPSSSSQSTVRGDFIDSLQTALAASDGNLSDAIISAVQSESTSTSNITVSPPPDPINTTVMIDIRIDNAVGFWGWTIPTVAWNASVLQLTGVAEGPYLADNTGGDPTAFIGNSPLLWDNTNGDIMGGLSEAIQAADTSTDSSGVLATLTFNVTGYGNSPITIGGGNLRANSNDTVGVNVTCNSASVSVLTHIIGDINGDGTVNILDAILLANAFGSHGPNYDYLGEPASPNWNPNADLNGDGIVNILDAILLANHFGLSYP